MTCAQPLRKVERHRKDNETKGKVEAVVSQTATDLRQKQRQSTAARNICSAVPSVPKEWEDACVWVCRLPAELICTGKGTKFNVRLRKHFAHWTCSCGRIVIFLSFSLYSLMHFLSLYSNAKAEISNFCNTSRWQLVCNLFPTITLARISYPGSRPVRAQLEMVGAVATGFLGPKTSCSERNLKLWWMYVCVCVCVWSTFPWLGRSCPCLPVAFVYVLSYKRESDCSLSCISDSLRNESGLICCFTLLSRYMHMLAGRVRRA